MFVSGMSLMQPSARQQRRIHMEWSRAQWIGLSQAQIRAQHIFRGEDNNHFAYFRLQISLTAEDLRRTSFPCLITANSRYRLWVNAQAILSGPCKGDRFRHYYEEIDLAPYLREGENVIAAAVLYCDPNQADDQSDPATSLLAVASPPVGHRFCMESAWNGASQEKTLTTGIAPWKVYFDPSFSLVAAEINQNLGAITEHIDLRQIPVDWKKADFDDTDWWIPEIKHPAAESARNRLVGFLPKLRLTPRPIPLLEEIPGTLTELMAGPAFDETGTVMIAAHTTATLLFHAGEIMSAYPVYRFSSGNNAHIHFTYFEKFSKDGHDLPLNRWKEGEPFDGGQQDSIILPGGAVTYEPFWMRTFRFVQITIETEDEALCLLRPAYHRTGYPLVIQTELQSDTPWVSQLYDICVRTMKNCMMDTYMDCPFYEQMEFIMDTRLQMLFSYSVSTDLRLAEKALEDFHCSMEPFGLIQGKYPSAYPQVISTFSLYYIYALYDYYQQTGRTELIVRYRTDVDTILEYFASRLDSETGMVGDIGYWPFVDWQEQWGDAGVPCNGVAPITVISLMYAYALYCGAVLYEATGREGVAKEYTDRQKQINTAVIRNCMSPERGMLKDGPQTEKYSQHVQSWAVVCGALQGEMARTAMAHALDDKDVIPCSFAASYELFRALEQTGLYGRTRELLQGWIDLIAKGYTTCPEVPVDGRSACHAWSALPVYELTRTIAGISSAEPGWHHIRRLPHPAGFPEIHGKIVAGDQVIEI